MTGPRLTATVIVIGQGGDIEPGDVASVAEVVVRRSRTVGEPRMSVQVTPEEVAGGAEIDRADKIGKGHHLLDATTLAGRLQ